MHPLLWSMLMTSKFLGWNCLTCWLCYKACYIITQNTLAFWLVLAYDLLEDRRIDDDSAWFKFFLIFLILNLNQSQFFAKHNNQSVRFIFYTHKITSVLNFRVCQSGKIWNKKEFFRYILIFLLYKTEFVEGTGYETRQTSKRDLFVRVLT